MTNIKDLMKHKNEKRDEAYFINTIELLSEAWFSYLYFEAAGFDEDKEATKAFISDFLEEEGFPYFPNIGPLKVKECEIKTNNSTKTSPKTCDVKFHVSEDFDIYKAVLFYRKLNKGN